MMKLRLTITLLLVAFLLPLINAQKGFNGLSKREIKQLSTVELIKGEKKFPESYLYGMHGDSLVLLTDISGWNEPTIFAKSKISVAGYDELVIADKQTIRRKSMLWGSILGAASFGIVQGATQTKSYERTISKAVLGQKQHKGYIEGIIAGVTGFGAGMIIGQTLAKRKFNLRSQKRKAMKDLREFSYR